MLSGGETYFEFPSANDFGFSFQIRFFSKHDWFEALKRRQGILPVPRRVSIWLLLVLSMAGVLGQEKEGGAAVHRVDGSCVREWLVLGPFLRRDTESDLLEGVGGEANVRPREGGVVTRKDGVQLRWTRLRSEVDLQNPGRVIEVPDMAVVYAYCELESEGPLNSYLRSYSSGLGTVWLNGKSLGPMLESVGVERELIGQRWEIQPALPMELKGGRNGLLLKLRTERDAADFVVQPLTTGWATVTVGGVEAAGIGEGAVTELYREGELYGRAKVGKGKVICVPEGRYDVRLTEGDRGGWRWGVSVSANGSQKVEVPLGNAVSISGKVVAMDGSVQRAMVVEATRGGEAKDATFRRAVESSLAPGRLFFERTLTDTNGNFRFVNLPPGEYRVRCHGREGYIDQVEGTTNRLGNWISVGAGNGPAELIFRFPEVKKGVWKSYQIMEGLVEVQPRTLDRAPEGQMWIGTDQSFLYEYDGVEFKVAAAAPEIPANEITVVRHDGGEGAWVGTVRGLARYANDRVEEFALGGEGGQNRVYDIFTDRDGTVWVGTRSGLFKRDGKGFVRVPLKDGEDRDTIHSILRDRAGVMWIGTSGGLLRWEGESFTLMDPFSGFSGRGVMNLHQAKDGAIWFSCARGGGLYRYDGREFRGLSELDGLLSDDIETIRETSDGTIWLASRSGLLRFNGRTIVNYTPDDGLSNLWIRELFVDADDVLWCGNGWGVSRFDPNGFVGFGQGDGIDRGEGPAEVFAIFPEREGSFLVGTGWRGLFRTDGETIERAQFVPTNSFVRQIRRAVDGSLWMGTSSALLQYRDEKLVQTLERPWVLGMCIDGEGNIWFGHGWNGGGATRHNIKTGEETVFGTGHGLPDDQVWALEPSSAGGVWLGTSSGLAHFQDGKIEAIPDPRGGAKLGVFHLRRDTNGVLWVGGRDGLNAVQEKERVWITKTNDWPGKGVWSSARSADGKIWMGTERHGLLGFDGKAATMLDKRDGLEGNSVFTVVTNRNDSLWLGFIDGGMTRYRPSKSRPVVRLRGLRVDDETVTNLMKVPKVKVGRRVTFNYQEIDLKTLPEKRQFWYRLADQAGRTIKESVTKVRSFDWTPESAGTYRFEVQAIDRDLNYSKPAGAIVQVVLPWHANPWLLGPSAILFVGLLVWAFVARALYLRKSREAVVLGERVRIARDLHDHLGAGLTHLAMVGDLVREKVDEPASVKMLATRLSESARELTRIMGEIIWSMDSEKDTLQSFALFVTRYAERFFAEKELRLRFDIPTDLPDLPVPAEIRNGLFMVSKEALNNVAKHAVATELRIKLELVNGELCLTFEDNGHGFSQSKHSSGHGLENMRNRVRNLGGELQIESREGEGTRVRACIRLPKK